MNNKKYGFVFPGQGSQVVNMLADIAPVFPEVQKTFAEASAILGYDLWQLTQEGPQEELDKTVHTQPALLAASYALWQIITQEKALKPVMLAGHSLGEYTALVAAGALHFTDAVRLVAARGQYMQEAVVPGLGGMAAIIGLDEVFVSRLCQQVAQPDEVLAPANFNSIGQIVIAGHMAAVERAIVLAKAQGARLVKIIPVSVPSHCALMQPAAERLAELLATIPIAVPRIPVINNADVMLYDNVEKIRDGLKRQLFMPVRWVEIIQCFIKQGINTVVECGPGKVLTGLNKRIDTNLQLFNTADLESMQALIQELTV